MPSDAKAKDKDKAKKAKPAGGEAKEKKPKKAKGDGEKAAEAAVATAPPPKPAEPRPPADPRLKVLKKFQGRFLPKGVLRERYKAIQQRWDSGDDHGGVTVEELKALLADWRATREKPPRLPKA
ncbi:MAG TPA: hypothetical protein VG406_11665 [Isosphaeraceae bacterium]|jgi:hypothetical protein|nr:hypothetical protein [Isosphaeraceae bacterium]